jgi:imidazole glycerol-phosphate synthase subunit HisH
MITIVDYGLGNVRAFCNVYERLNIKTKIARTAHDLKNSEKIIFPGVGSFDYAMMLLNNSGMRDELEEQVLIKKVPVIGICVGMQILAAKSEEGILPGLGWIDGEVRKFKGLKGRDNRRIEEENMSGVNANISLPHMGWNDVVPVEVDSLFRGMKATRFYFLHSYYFNSHAKSKVLATTEYHGVFASAAREGNIFGVQFHPEKSHSDGVRLLQNFALL